MKSIELPDQSRGVGDYLKPIAVGGLGLAALGTSVYLHFKEIDPVLKAASILPYCEDISNELDGDYEAVVVGGLPIDAINDETSVINAKARTITVSDVFRSPLLRKNGTVRDFDILVFYRDDTSGFVRLSDETVDTMKSRVAEAAGKRSRNNNLPVPDMSLFSFESHDSLVHSATIATEDGRLVLEQGYVRQELPETTMEAWQLLLPGGMAVQVLNPWEQYWRSMVRFSSGMKVKDTEKLAAMRDRLRQTDGLADQEQGELCKAYEVFYDAMREQNTFAAMIEAIQDPERDWGKVSKLGQLAAMSGVLSLGQKIPAAQRLVQATPRLFHPFVSSK